MPLFEHSNDLRYLLVGERGLCLHAKPQERKMRDDAAESLEARAGFVRCALCGQVPETAKLI